AQSEAKIRALEIERLKLMLAKARREMFGQSSERGKLLVEQLELAIEDLEETQAEEEAKAENLSPFLSDSPPKFASSRIFAPCPSRLSAFSPSWSSRCSPSPREATRPRPSSSKSTTRLSIGRERRWTRLRPRWFMRARTRASCVGCAIASSRCRSNCRI
ncbi:MAG: transposase, partial [Methylocystis sp.]